MTLTFPATRERVESCGYKFVFARPCKRCKAELEFHRTPAGKLAPLECRMVDGAWMMVSHFTTCPFADEFHTKPEQPAPPKTGDLFGGKP